MSTAFITAGAMAVMLLVALIAANRLVSSQVETALSDRVASVETTLQVRQGRLVVPSPDADDVVDGVWIFDRDGTELSGPEAGRRTSEEVSRLASVAGPTTVQRGERVFLARPVSVPGEPAVGGVAVATESLDVYEGSRDIMLGTLGVAAILVVAFVAATTAWTVSRALRPVAEMSASADEWDARDLDARFALSGRDEIARLGRTLDGLLERVAHAIRAEQQLTGELAHELRTPLSAIRGEAELALMHEPAKDSRERFTRILEQVDRVSDTISALLELARLAATTGRHADVGEVVAGLVASRPPSAATVDVTAAAGMHAAAAAELLERIVAPVVDNAVRHARSSVEVVVRRRDGHVVVEVSDDGPGLEATDAEQIFAAGFRRSDDPNGAGLGLALSRRVVGTVGGTVSVTSLRDPTVFTIEVPEAR